MGNLPKKKRAGIIVGSIVGLFVLMGMAGSHQQTPTADLNSTPASNTIQASDGNGADTSSASSPSSSTPATSSDSSAGDDTSSSADTGLSDSNLSNDNTYTNVDGTTVHSPADSTDGSVPSGATAQCVDGTYSFSQHHSGTCSHHGGVASWL